MGTEPHIAQMMTGQAPPLPIFEPADFHPHGSTSELAEILQISTRRVRELVADGVLPREDRGKFDISECSRRYIQFLNRPETATRRAAALGVTTDKRIGSARRDLLQAQAERQQLRLAKERGELIPIHLFKDELIRTLQVVRDRLLKLPEKVAVHLVGLPAGEITRELDRAVRSALSELAQSGGGPPASTGELAVLQTSANGENSQTVLQTSANEEQ